MNSYNQTTIIENQTCTGETSTGFCSDWYITKEITFHYFDLFILTIVVLLPFFLINLLRRRK